MALLIGFIAIWSYLEALNIDIRHVYVRDGAFSGVIKDISIVQISDLHIGQGDRRIERTLEILQDLKADAIVLTGDYVKWNGDYELALNFLAQLKANKGVYAVMGDYDYSNSRKSCLFCHEQGSGKPTKRHPVKFLRNSCNEVTFGADATLVCGIDGRQADEPLSPDVVKCLQGAPKGRAAIVLSHSPLVFDLVDDDQDVLILSGDTHGGQIPIPSWLWSLIGYAKNMKYEQGWFEKGEKKMYVNRGVGTSHFPIRFMRLPEITVFHFGEQVIGDGQ